MNYHKYEIKTDPETAEILVAFLSNSPFDTFEESSDGLNAYAPAAASEAEIESQLADLQSQFDFTWETFLNSGF